MEAINASKIGTNYYKLGHITGVKYSLFQLTTNNDQALLELELAIRYKHPDILLTYNNKGLYYFQFGHNDETLDLSKEYPELVCKISKTISIEMVCNPPKPNTANNTTANTTNNPSGEGTPAGNQEGNPAPNGTDKHAPYIGLSLLKAIKKLILFKLSKTGTLRIFGNHGVFQYNEISNYIVYLEPAILPNGDILLCAMQKVNLELFNSSILPVDAEDLSSNFIIYLTPSGIRCHLFDSLKVLNSFTYTPPKNQDHVLNLLKLATGIDLSDEDNLLWVKLIPNLQHLNNQTSKISKFIHQVDNKKYILWPWKLCLLQFGKYEKIVNQRSKVPDQFQSTSTSDPLGLISEFMDFNISKRHQIQSANLNIQQLNPGSVNVPTFNAPTVLSTGGSVEHKSEMPMEINEMQMMPDLFGGIPTSVNNDFFDDDVKIMDNIDEIEDNHAKVEPPTSGAGSDNKEEELDDLFGGDEDDDDDEERGSVHVKPEDIDLEADLHNVHHQTIDVVDQNDVGMQKALQDSHNDLLSVPGDGNDSLSNEDSDKNNSFVFDLPRDQMTIVTKDPTPYDDPGAPLPIMPTPLAPQIVDRSKLNSVGGPDSDIPSSKSVFSPILFNPLIKSNVDDKYGKGGKFYVDRDNKDADTSSQKLRATSVTGFEIRRPDEHFKRGLGIDYRQESKVFFDSDEEAVEVNDRDDEDDEDEGEGDITYNNSHILDDDDDEEEEEESDEDADVDLNVLKDTPLKLNTNAETFQAAQIQAQTQTQTQIQTQALTVPSIIEPPHTIKFPTSAPFNTALFNTGGFSSPMSTNLPQSSKLNNLPKFDSPFAIHDSPMDDKIKYSSPLALESDDFRRSTPTPGISTAPTTASGVKNSTSGNSSSNGSGQESRSSVISESPNCLPLILRGVNVISIPTEFLLNNIIGAIKMSASASDFNMDVDQEDEDFEISKKNEMVVKVDNLNEFLSWLSPNLVFDLGLTDFKRGLISDLPEEYGEHSTSSASMIESEKISDQFESSLSEQFPFSYKVKLDELLSDLSEMKNEDTYPVDNQLSFLDDITNDEILNPKSKMKKLDLIEWDSIYTDNPKNDKSFKKYIKILNEINEDSILDVTGAIKSLNENKIKVIKNSNEIINLNAVSLRFWKYLNFNPLQGTKSFQLLLISETLNNTSINSYNQEFLDSLIYNYHECNFGTISKITLETTETRQDLEQINQGLILINKSDDNYNSVYKEMNKKLNSLVELIKLDLINKTNRFEFDRPLLLMFLDFNPNLNSLVEISKVCRNFKVMLKRHQLPLVQVFSKVIPARYIIKEIKNQRSLKHLSNHRLTQLSMNLYNQCPDPSKSMGDNNAETSSNLFTAIVKEPISKFNFKFFNNNGLNKDNYSDDDAFLHLAYERSVDKNWVSAAWSDPLGIVTHTKSWCSAAGLLKPTSNTSNPNGLNDSKNVHDLHSISDQIFEISNELFKKLNNEIIRRTSGLGGKKFLVLTRVNSIIPDDELIHWKRLSMKFKDVSLIVLSVSGAPRVLFEDLETPASTDFNDKTEPEMQPDNIISMNIDGDNPVSDTNGQGIKLENQDPTTDFFKSFNNLSNSNNPSPSNSNMMTSPSSNFNFAMNSTTNFLSPDVSGGLSTSVATSNSQVKNDNSFNLYMNSNEMKEVILQDPNDSVLGLIPSTSVPSFNTPTSPGMKMGYLMKKSHQRYTVFEVHLLSCSNYWNLKSLMLIILNHYKKMITLNDILCTRNMESMFGDEQEKQNYTTSSIIPWHIMAVTKSLNYLVHIDVEE